MLVMEVLRVAEGEGAEGEIIHLVDFDLKPCNGCGLCFETRKCEIEDDVEKIFDKIRDADGVIIGSPVYFQSVSAQTKTFIDRVGFLHIARERKIFRNKVGGAVVVARRSGLASALSQILMFFVSARMIMASPAVMSLAREKGEAAKDTEAIANAMELGRTMAQIAKATAFLRET